MNVIRVDQVRRNLGELLRESPYSSEDIIDSLGLYLYRKPLADILTINSLYQRARTVPGAFFEFGVLQGRHVALLAELKKIYEPHNNHRTIVGFDTFKGFVGQSENDGSRPNMLDGTPRYSLPASNVEHLRAVMRTHELDPEHTGIELVEGDAQETVKQYLTSNPHTVVALAYFDMDLYAPTLEVLRQIRPRLVPGSIIAFDQIGHVDWPGETAAFHEFFTGSSCELAYVVPGVSTVSFVIWPG